MPNSHATGPVTTFNKYGLHLRWPRLWIVILGIILIFLCFSIAGMEIGNTLFDLRRGTTFGGFILFIPLLICGILVVVTAFRPRLILLRVAVIFSVIMIILLLVLVAYDILVLVDPTRCYFFDCNTAPVYQSNSTSNTSVVGWPLYITWPSYFQTNMNAKRIFQGVQLLCAISFILFAALYLLTYFIYRHIKLDHQTVYEPDRAIVSHNEVHRVTPTKLRNHASPTFPQYHSHQRVTTYMIEGHPDKMEKYQYAAASPVVPVIATVTPRKAKAKPNRRLRANSLSYERLCTRCNREPRLILRTPFERQNFFGYLCVNCNNELVTSRRRAPVTYNRSTGKWKP